MTCSSVLELKLYSWNPPRPLVSQLHTYAIYAGTGHHINVDKKKDTTLESLVNHSSGDSRSFLSDSTSYTVSMPVLL